jgi:hypothetical protein
MDDKDLDEFEASLLLKYPQETANSVIEDSGTRDDVTIAGDSKKLTGNVLTTETNQTVGASGQTTATSGY